MQVLIVDEHRLFRETFREELLNHLPYISIQEAINGQEAIEKIHRIPPSHIFMDIYLPGINGLDLAKKIKQAYPSIRVAILTGYDFPEYRRLASQYGVDRYFVKDSLDWKEIEEFIQYVPKENR